MTPDVDWPVRRLDDVAEIQTGIAKGKVVDDAAAINVPYLRVANVQDGFLDLSEMKSIQVEPRALARYALRPGDVLFTEGGDFDKLGRGCVWRGEVDPCLHQNHVFAVRTHPDVLLPEFLALVASSPHGKAYFLDCSKQTTNLASINSTQLRAFPVILPAVPEQAKITAILSSVNDAVEATQAVIGQLGVVKKAMMADLLTRGLPGRHKGFKQTEIGEVPAEWETATYGSLAAPVSAAIQSGPFGSELKHSEFTPEGPLVIGIDNVLDGRFSLGSQHRIPETKFRALNRFEARPLDLLITVMATVGRCCVVPKDIEQAIITKHVYRLTVDQSRANPYFLMFCLYGVQRLASEVRGSAQGLTRPGLNKSLLLPLRFPLPPLDEQNEIVNILRTVDERVQREQETLDGLRPVKSALTSVLLTGEVRVKPDEEAA